jgi:hypothetical protein
LLQLSNPDFSTAVRITDAINAYSQSRFGRKVAAEQDARSIICAARWGFHRPFLVGTREPGGRIRRPGARRGRRALRDDRHRPGRPHFTGRVSHGNLTVRITEMPRVVQPDPFSRARPRSSRSPRSRWTSRTRRPVGILDGPDLESLVAGLNSLGVKPDGIIAILQGIKSAGALQGELCSNRTVRWLPSLQTKRSQGMLGRRDRSCLPSRPLPASTEQAVPEQLEGMVNDDIRRFCTNIADAARDRRYSLQRMELETLQADIESRIAALEAKRAEYEEWLKRRDDFLEQARGGWSTSTAACAPMRPPNGSRNCGSNSPRPS